MYSKLLSRSLSAITLLVCSGLAIGASDPKRDSFYPYSDFVKKPLFIEAKELEHYAAQESMIRQKLKLDLSRRERAIIGGLHWIIRVADQEKNFTMIFPDLMLLMDKMANSHGRIHQKEIAESIIKQSLLRAEPDLNKFFDDAEQSGWSFLGLFSVLNRFPDIKKRYAEFYKKKWPNHSESTPPDTSDFVDVMAALDYKEIFNFLVYTSFFHHYIIKEKNAPAKFPRDKFPEYIKAFEKFEYKDHPVFDQKFRALGYLATHIPLVLTNYGEFPLKKSPNAEKVQKYIESSFEKARILGDFDLFAEYIQCLKMFNPEDSRIKNLEEFIYGLQRPDGSWGSARDFKTNGYTMIHPAGAAMMALNQP